MTANETTTLAQVLSACARNQERDLNDLFTLLSQPSISTQNIGVRECAELVKSLLDDAGLATRLIESSGHPFVYGEYPAPAGAPTVLFYGHYDVQPPEPLDAWLSPPFEPTIRDGRIYARGVGDNKGQFFAHIAALRAWRETTGGFPIGIKFLAEGEEECGSPHIEEFVKNHRALLDCDLVYTSDGPMLDDDAPTIEYGVRGMVYVELRAKGPSHDLHSGNWGGLVPNPAWTLVHLLATMFTPDGDILIEGFHDGITPMSAAGKAAIERLTLDQAATLATVGVTELPAPKEASYFSRTMERPTCNIAGFSSGYEGVGSKTIIPSTAMVKLDFRLVPDQDPDDIFRKIDAHVLKHAPEVEIQHFGGMRPSSTPLENRFVPVVQAAVTSGFGIEPVEIPIAGGSLPDAVWTKDLGRPSFLVPYANRDEANHSPNENLVLENFYAGIRTSANLLAGLAALDDPGR